MATPEVTSFGYSQPAFSDTPIQVSVSIHVPPEPEAEEEVTE